MNNLTMYHDYLDNIKYFISLDDINCELSDIEDVSSLDFRNLNNVVKEIEAVEYLESILDKNFIDKKSILENVSIDNNDVSYVDSIYDLKGIELIDTSYMINYDSFNISPNIDLGANMLEDFKEDIDKITEFTNTLSMSITATPEYLDTEINIFGDDEEIEDLSNTEYSFDEDLDLVEAPERPDFDFEEEGILDYGRREKIQNKELWESSEVDSDDYAPEDEIEKIFNSIHSQHSDKETLGDYLAEEVSINIEEKEIDETEEYKEKLKELREELTNTVNIETKEDKKDKIYEFTNPNITASDKLLFNAVVGFHSKVFQIPRTFRKLFVN